MPVASLYKVTLFGIFLIAAQENSVQAQSTNTESEFLNKMLGVVCGAYESSGKNKEIELNVAARAEINSLIKKLIDGGGNISGSFNVDQYVGVLQTDLQRDRASVRDCRERVWRDLKDRLQISAENSDKDPEIKLNGDKNKSQEQENNDIPTLFFVSGENRFGLEEFLEKDGVSEKRFKIKNERHCQIKTFSMSGPGKKFSFLLQSEKGAVFLRSIVGYSNQSTSIPPGTYNFIMKAIEAQGNYQVQIISYCNAD